MFTVTCLIPHSKYNSYLPSYPFQLHYSSKKQTRTLSGFWSCTVLLLMYFKTPAYCNDGIKHPPGWVTACPDSWTSHITGNVLCESMRSWTPRDLSRSPWHPWHTQHTKHFNLNPSRAVYRFTLAAIQHFFPNWEDTASRGKLKTPINGGSRFSIRTDSTLTSFALTHHHVHYCCMLVRAAG